MLKRVRSALRLRQKAAEKFKCKREESFSEMFVSLGNPKALLDIHTREKGMRHCKFLKNDPHACICFSEEIKGGSNEIQLGELCPNNPFRKHAEIFDELSKYAPLLDQVEELEIAVALGRVPAFTETTPNQIFVAHLIQQMNSEQNMIAQQTMGMSSASTALGGAK